MRAVFTKQHLAFQDRCIESPDSGFIARSYILTPLRKVLMWAGVSRRLEPKSTVYEASLRLCIVNRKGMPGKLSIARMRRPVFFNEATWIAPSKTSQFQAGGGLEGPDFTAPRQLSFVATSDEHLLSIDVTDDVRSWIMRGEPNYGWILAGMTQIAGYGAVRFTTCPTLDVRYSGGRTDGASALVGVHDARGG